MTATLTEHDAMVDIIVEEVIDLDLPCEAETPCDKRAEWKVRVKCCNNLWLLCQECVDEVIRQFIEHKDSRIKCAKCDCVVLMRNFVGSVHRI